MREYSCLGSGPSSLVLPAVVEMAVEHVGSDPWFSEMADVWAERVELVERETDRALRLLDACSELSGESFLGAVDGLCLELVARQVRLLVCGEARRVRRGVVRAAA